VQFHLHPNNTQQNTSTGEIPTHFGGFHGEFLITNTSTGEVPTHPNLTKQALLSEMKGSKMLAIGKELSVEQRLSKAVVDIMGNPKYVALAGVLMIGDRTVRDDIPTACTNGRDEMYGREFVSGLKDVELRFLVLHECYHKLYRHLTTWEHLYREDPDLANQACDYVINCKITDDNRDGFAVMPSMGLLDPKYRGWDSAQVYKALKEDGDGQGNSSQQGFDEHDWEGAQELSDDEQRELARDLDEAIRQGALIAGKIGSGGDRDLEELLKPQIDWREVLREFITATCTGSDYSTWRRPNRRYIAAGHYMPSGITEQVGELVVAIDTSGSIGSRELTQFLSEVKGVCDMVHPERIRLLYWDTKVCADETYATDELEKLVSSTKPVGGGGTDIDCVPEYITKHNIQAQAVIVLTDGYLGGSWGTWSTPLLWCILDNERAKPDCGKTVNIKGREL
jgi:predicted metal-dependent peptidase